METMMILDFPDKVDVLGFRVYGKIQARHRVRGDASSSWHEIASGSFRHFFPSLFGTKLRLKENTKK